MGFNEVEQWMKDNDIKSPSHREQLRELYRYQILNYWFAEYNVVDLGSKEGASAIAMATGIQAHKIYNNKVRIITVDNGKEIDLDKLSANIKLANSYFGCDIEFVNGDSLDLLESLSDDFISCIHIDSLHHYDHVVKELLYMRPKTMEGSLVCGDDYTPIEYGVIKAVDEWRLANKDIFIYNGFYLSMWWSVRSGRRK